MRRRKGGGLPRALRAPTAFWPSWRWRCLPHKHCAARRAFNENDPSRPRGFGFGGHLFAIVLPFFISVRICRIPVVGAANRFPARGVTAPAAAVAPARGRGLRSLGCCAPGGGRWRHGHSARGQRLSVGLRLAFITCFLLVFAARCWCGPQLAAYPPRDGACSGAFCGVWDWWRGIYREMKGWRFPLSIM